MAEVNPAPIRLPKKLINDPEVSKYFQDLNFMVFQLLQRTGGGIDIIGEGNAQTVINTAGIAQNVIAIGENSSDIDQNETDIETNATNITTNALNIAINAGAIDQLDRYFPNLLPQIEAINEQIGSGDFLTSDETGFSVDMTTLSVDMTEA